MCGIHRGPGAVALTKRPDTWLQLTFLRSTHPLQTRGGPYMTLRGSRNSDARDGEHRPAPREPEWGESRQGKESVDRDDGGDEYPEQCRRVDAHGCALAVAVHGNQRRIAFPATGRPARCLR